MLCSKCQRPAKKSGKAASGQQRFKCMACKVSFIDHDAKPLGDSRIPMEKATLCLKLLLEGTSIRSTERITGIHRDTIMGLLITAGEKAKDLMESRIVNMPVEDVEIDEIWGFVGMKEKTRANYYSLSDNVGDSWCYVGFEANTKLILSWHLGKRTPQDTHCFMEKLQATVNDNRFQMTTDGYKPYPNAVRAVFGQTVNYAQLIKQYGTSDDERRYSPAPIISIDKHVVIGEPSKDRICTSFVFA